MPTQTTEIIRLREPYYVTADIHVQPVFCGDEREAVNPDEIYIHEFGGVANTAYTLMTLQEAVQPGSADQPFDEVVASLVPILAENEVRAGVHSDTHAEHASEFQTNQHEGDIGCGYLKARQAISDFIGKNGAQIIEILHQQDPELYGSERVRQRAKEMVEAHSRLAERNIFPSGRQIALKALEAGAPIHMVQGDHIGKEGIINKRLGTTLNSTEALRNGLPTYDHDSWAAKATFDKLHSLYPYDKVDYEIANDIDAVGTMLVLGVENIVVRR